MTQISLLMNNDQNRRHSENQGPGGIVIFGMQNGEPHGPEEFESLAAAVQILVKAQPRAVRYNTVGLNQIHDTTDKNKGMVLVEVIGPGHYPRVWVEDHLIPLPNPGPGTLGNYGVMKGTSSSV